MSNLDTLIEAGLATPTDDLDAAERAAIESLTEEELDALLNEPRTSTRKGTPTFHVIF
jgi:hypothetical protein